MSKKHESKEDKILSGIERIMQKLIEHDVRFDNHDARFDRHDVRFDNHDARFDDHDARFDDHDARFDNQDARFDSYDARFDSIESAVLDGNARIKELQDGQKEIKYIVNIAVTNHESRIRKLEHKVGA